MVDCEDHDEGLLWRVACVSVHCLCRSTNGSLGLMMTAGDPHLKGSGCSRKLC